MNAASCAQTSDNLLCEADIEHWSCLARHLMINESCSVTGGGNHRTISRDVARVISMESCELSITTISGRFKRRYEACVGNAAASSMPGSPHGRAWSTRRDPSSDNEREKTRLPGHKRSGIHRVCHLKRNVGLRCSTAGAAVIFRQRTVLLLKPLLTSKLPLGRP